jgi:hypothetical protein
MCFNKDISLASFFIGSLSGYTLSRYGNKEYQTTNKIVGYFFIYVSFMQLIDYFIWADLDCTKGLNRFAGYIGPLLNNFQPVVLYLLCQRYAGAPKNELVNKTLMMCNLMYTVYTLFMYTRYVSQGKLCGGLNDGHIKWPWINEYDKTQFNYLFYQIIMMVNIVAFLHDKVMFMSMLISYVLFFISYKYYKTNIGELWCYFVIYVPLLLLAGQKASKHADKSS